MGRSLRFWSAAILSLSLICSPLLRAQSAGDVSAPRISHALIDNIAPAGQPITIAATVIDDSGVRSVALFYRQIGTNTYERLSMAQIKDTAMYSVTIPGEWVKDPGIEYYIEATDSAGNALLRGFSYSPLVVYVNPPQPSRPVAAANAQQESAGSKTWIWILVGVGVAAGVALAASGGGGSDGGGGSGTGTVIIGGELPN